MPEPQLSANGLNLNSRWCQVEDLSPLLASAGRRGANVTVPGRHGVIRTPRKRYHTADLVLPLHVKGVDRATGLPASGALQANIDHLLRVFHAETVVLEYTREDGTARTAVTELMLEPVVITRERSVPPLARVGVPLTVFGAFWFDSASVSQTVTSGDPVPLTAFEGATAPMQNLLITFSGPVNNPQLTHGTKWVKYHGVLETGQQLVLNTETWQVSSGTGTPWEPDLRQVEFGEAATWLELNPAVNPFEITFTHTGVGTATCTIAGRRAYLAP